MHSQIPLAEKMRPTTLDQVLGQQHLTGNQGTVARMLKSGHLQSMIF